jgi:hypothetical protein
MGYIIFKRHKAMTSFAQKFYNAVRGAEKTVLEDGTVELRDKKGQLHSGRFDEPAVTKPDGTLEWWNHGQRHRSLPTAGAPSLIDWGPFPAVINPDGSYEIWRKGELKGTGQDEKSAAKPAAPKKPGAGDSFRL